jgi:hypothetical protein
VRVGDWCRCLSTPPSISSIGDTAAAADDAADFSVMRRTSGVAASDVFSVPTGAAAAGVLPSCAGVDALSSGGACVCARVCTPERTPVTAFL